MTASLGAGTAHASATTTTAGPAITASPDSIYSPTPLCPGSSHPTATTVTGTGFPASTAYRVVYNGQKATKVTGTTSASGTFTAVLNNIDQPDGYYRVKAVAGTATAITWVATDGYTCVTGSGTPTALNWKWQGAGFDANTTATMLVNAKVYHSTMTAANGAFNVTFTASCTRGTNPTISFQAYIQGKQVTFGAGRFSCS